jgi:hypothetical protein
MIIWRFRENAVILRTGQVFGQRPRSIPKIVLLILCIIAALSLIFYGCFPI